MIPRLIVVATHNGDERVQQIAAATDDPILVVDTGSTTRNYLIRGAVLELPHVVGWIETPYKGYDTGAYLWAYFNVEAEHYMFMQDSCLPKERNFADYFHISMPKPLGVCAWNGFSMQIWDTHEQRATVEYMYGEGPVPEQGIFGPIFYTSRKTLDLLAKRQLLPPYPMHKQMAQAMERAWAIAFFRAQVRTVFLTESYDPDREAMSRGNLPFLIKTFGGRT